MKRVNAIVLIAALIIVFSGCEKGKDPAGRRNIGVTPVITSEEGGFINGEPGSTVSFTVALPAGVTVENARIEVSRQANMLRAKFCDVTSFPATITLTLGEVIEKLGVSSAALENGDIIYIEVITTSNGVTTRSNAALPVTVLCKFEPLLATGSYHSVSPPDQWNSEGNISITADAEDPFKLYVSGLETIEGLNEDQGPLVMHINPSSFAVIADKTVLASDAWGDTNIAYEGTGLFNSCTGSFTMNFHISTDQGDYGTYQFTFTRNSQPG